MENNATLLTFCKFIKENSILHLSFNIFYLIFNIAFKCLLVERILSNN